MVSPEKWSSEYRPKERVEKLTPQESFNRAIDAFEELLSCDEKDIGDNYQRRAKEKVSRIIEDLNNARSLQLNPGEKFDLANAYRWYKKIEHRLGPFSEEENFKRSASLLESVSHLLNDGLDGITVEEMEKMAELEKKKLKKSFSLEEARELNGLTIKLAKTRDLIETMSWARAPRNKYKEFDPYLELKKIRQGTPEEKKKRLAEYKKQLAKQKEGIADLQVELEKQIRKNPDMSIMAFLDLIDKKAPELKLSVRQIGIFLTTFCKYREKHRAVELYRKQYKDDKKLFEVCFGHPPKGKIEIIKGPMTLYFRCHNLKDYALIHNHKFKPEDKLTRDDIKNAKISGGATIYEGPVPELRGVITVENAEGRPFDEWSKEAIRHEEQHALKKLFEEQRVRGNWYSLFAIEDFSKEESQKALVDYLRWRKEGFEERAKGEVLAYLKGGAESPNEILNKLLRQKKRRGLYDYYRQWYETEGKEEKEKIIKRLKERKKFSQIKKILGQGPSRFIKKIMDKILVREYHRDLSRAIIAVRKLQEKGFSNEKIVKLLMIEPLGNWLKLVRRLKEVK